MKSFRKITVFILAVLMIFNCFACASGSGNGTQSTTEGEKSEIIGWTEHSYTKLRADKDPDPADTSLTNKYTVYMSKGETEGCQLVLWSEDEYSGVMMRLKSGDNENLSYKLYIMDRTHTVKGKQYTDSAVLYSGAKTILNAEQTTPYIVEFTSTASTLAGDYEYVFEYLDSDGNVYCDFEITVHVWDFELPVDKTFATAVGIDRYNIQRLNGACPDSVYKAYYDMLLEHNMSAYNLPYDILSDEADAYMSDPRVTSFVIPNTDDDELLVKYYNKVKSDPVWFEKAIIYPLDEPREIEHLVDLKARCERISRLCPGLKMVSPFYTNIQVGEGKDQVDHMTPYTNLWCPKLCMWDDSMSYSDLDYTPSKSFAERMEEMENSGDTMWCYICNHPTSPYLNIWVDYPGIQARVLFWQQYQRGIDGFLYWQSTAWSYHDYMGDPWKSPYTGVKDGNGNPVYGEGYLFYPGRKIGLPMMPTASIRMKIMRDGIDDYEMFLLASEHLGKEYVMSVIERVTPTLTKVNVNDDQFADIRIQLGEALENAIKSNS